MAPGGLFWNLSNSLSIGRFPFDPNSDKTNADDDLWVQFATPQTAVGFTIVDAMASPGQRAFFFDEDYEVILSTPLPQEYAPYRRFIGLVATRRPIAAILTVDPPNDGDDVNYDDFVFVRAK